jgi:hypothetical protein
MVIVQQMQIRTRMSMSADGYVTTPSGWPALMGHRALGALDKLELVVLPILLGGGMRLTDGLSPDAGLTFESERALPGGSVEIVYAVSPAREVPGREAEWSPASQRPS